jgi:glycine cleavage system aminomethyltransferase T
MRVTSRGAPGLVKTERAAQGGRVLQAEYEALRTHAGVFALDDRVVVRATGADRVSFLQGMLTNDVATLRPGDGCAALLLTIQGRVVADVRVAAVDDALLLDVDRAACEGFIAALDRLIIADEVELAVDEHTRLLGVSGPATPDLVPGLAALAPFGHATARIGDVPVRVVHASAIGGEGAILHVAADGLRGCGTRSCMLARCRAKARRSKRAASRPASRAPGRTWARRRSRSRCRWRRRSAPPRAATSARR